MKLITWTESLNVGILEIDEQHKKLISLLNKTAEVIVGDNSKEQVYASIKEIMNFTLIHFSTEEKMFKISKYKQAKKHIEEHQKLIKKANEFLLEYSSNKITITETTMNFFMDWIVNHILISDIAYAKPIRAAGYK